MRLKNSRKIAIAAVTAAIAFLCVLVGRFTPIGGFFLLAVSGTMTMFAVRLTGVVYGALSYVAVALLSVLALPFGFFYIILIGPHAVLRGLVFGAPPYKKIRLAIGYPVLIAFAYGVSVALYYLAGAVLGEGITSMVDSLTGGVFVFALIATAIILLYDAAVAYLSGCLERLIVKKKKKTVAPPPAAGDNPFGDYLDTVASDGGNPSQETLPPEGAHGQEGNPSEPRQDAKGSREEVIPDAETTAEQGNVAEESLPAEREEDAGGKGKSEEKEPAKRNPGGENDRKQ